MFAVSLCTSLYAGDRCEVWEIEGAKDRFEIQLRKPATSLSFHGMPNGAMLSVLLDGEKHFNLNINDHLDGNSSYLVLSDAPFSKVVLLNPENLSLQGTLKCYDGSYSDITFQEVNARASAFKKGKCDLPPIIDQDVWRKDLQDPKTNPASTKVEHLVVHHSATTNDVNDYLLAVRNIYLYHVNSNGWDDVGYNFLIDPNGVLYAGRDGQGTDDDNIRGAHFCAKNSNTMGICLIGNYSELPPPDTLIHTLSQLLAWKVKKESLQPLESSFHPRGSSTGFVLPRICGHRDGYKAGVYSGCNTECPGNYTYDLMDTVRNIVVRNLLDCDYVVGTASLQVEKTLLKIDQQAGQTRISSTENGRLVMYDALGRQWLQGTLKENTSLSATAPKGVYILYFESARGTHWQKFLIE